MVANSPGDGALLIARLIGLALDARVHDVISANGAIVDVDVPGPKSNSIPFFNFKNCLLLHL